MTQGVVGHWIERTFDALQREGRKALIAHVCVGDPSIEVSMELAAAAVEGGADLIELSVPFSDSGDQGAALARAAGRAIAQGASLGRAIEHAGRLAVRVNAPVVIATHHVPVLVMGPRRVLGLAQQSGVAGLLVVDLPSGDQVITRLALDSGLAMVPFAVLGGDDEAIATILREREGRLSAPRGFVHLVARGSLPRGGLEGYEPDAPPPSTRAMGLISARVQAAATRARAEMPVVIGSALDAGIDSGASARKAAGPTGEGADGIVVDGAISMIVESSATDQERIDRVRSLMRSLREALD
ncbi:MAG TPA: tryptophan synthase subunit alpha [Candidatus Nanopelagicales bacterium]|nr:tryptophan synthase subunit alpha [Candidatus Nanopelagicales bacterium]